MVTTNAISVGVDNPGPLWCVVRHRRILFEDSMRRPLVRWLSCPSALSIWLLLLGPGAEEKSQERRAGTYSRLPTNRLTRARVIGRHVIQFSSLPTQIKQRATVADRGLLVASHWVFIWVMLEQIASFQRFPIGRRV